MNLQQVQALKDLYPQLRTRSGLLITTNEMSSKLTKDGEFAVTVKTVFPPSALRRTELVVAQADKALHVRAVEPRGLADAQRFAGFLRGRLELAEPPAPLCLVKAPDGVKFFVVAPAASDSTPTSTDDAAETNSQNGDS